MNLGSINHKSHYKSYNRGLFGDWFMTNESKVFHLIGLNLGLWIKKIIWYRPYYWVQEGQMGLFVVEMPIIYNLNKVYRLLDAKREHTKHES